jgi:predicted MFS family arabinose efflux permease
MHFLNLTIAGIANIVGKLVTGYLLDFRWINTQALSNVLILICGIDILCMPLNENQLVMTISTYTPTLVDYQLYSITS